MIPVLEALSELYREDLAFLGDSVLAHMWTVAAQVVRAKGILPASDGLMTRWPPSGEWPSGVQWFCIPETRGEIEHLMKRTPHLWSDQRDPAEKSVLVISFGGWYNPNLGDTCGERLSWDATVEKVSACERAQRDAAAYRSLARPRSSGFECRTAGEGVRKDAEERWHRSPANPKNPFNASGSTPRNKAALACRQPARTWTPSSTLDPCSDHQGDKCAVRHDNLTQCALARDTAELAKWVESNRRHLPRHIFALDNPPTHHTTVNNIDSGRWRTSTRAVWAKYAPSVHIINAFELLVDRGGDHILARDPQHWCIDSIAYEQYMSFVLTAMIATIRNAAV